MKINLEPDPGWKGRLIGGLATVAIVATLTLLVILATQGHTWATMILKVIGILVVLLLFVSWILYGGGSFDDYPY